ncbi:ATP-binding cassette domain-containing protein [soil metagenome]
MALRDVDLTIEPGERVLLLGPSGSGKSTLVHALAGVLGGADEGETTGALTLDGSPPNAARGRAGLVLQDPESQTVMARIGDDVAFGCENLGVPRDEIWRRVPAALEAVGLTLPLAHPTAELSGGQKQRLALAGALAMRPGLLLLDEPTANLDPAGVSDVRDAVRRVLDATGATAVIVEHRVEVWLDVVTRIVVLGAEGTVIADGAPADVLPREGVALAAAGVWVPGREPVVDLAASPRVGAALLVAHELGIARVPGRAIRAGIELELAAGEVLAVTGPNGSGKSTLALTLGGLLPPAAGEVRAFDELAAGAGPAPIRWKSRQLLPRLGSVFQAPEHQFLTATVRDELAVGPRALLGRKSGAVDTEVARIVGPLLERLGLESLAGAHPFTLSGGQKRRLSVGTALATQPRVLLLDEPTFGQDARTWVELVTLLDEVRRDGNAVVAVTHDERFLNALHARPYPLVEEHRAQSDASRDRGPDD